MLRSGVLRSVTAPSASVEIRRATPADFQAVEQLLRSNDLPLDGVPVDLSGFFVAARDATLVGVVGIEDCAEYGLLRSAAVDRDSRGLGIGRQLLERAIDGAKDDRKKALYLLTTTAEEYFPAFGFQVATRDKVPAPIRETSEFTTACPASATVMKLDLT